MVTAQRNGRVSSLPMGVTAVERSFGELLAALGDVVVARSRGGPVDPATGSTRALAGRFRGRRRRFEAELTSIDEALLTADDARAVANMRAALGWVDTYEPTPGLPPKPGAIGAHEDAATARSRATLYRRYTAATAGLRIDGRPIDRLSILARLATEPDPGRRRRLFEAMAPLWRAVDGDGAEASPYRRLLAGVADRWRAQGSPIEANAAALGMPLGTLEPTLRSILAAWRPLISPKRVEPWDYWHAVGAASRRLDRLVPVDRLLGLNRDYLASLGADPDGLGIAYDVRQRTGRPPIPVAFTMGMGAWADDQPPLGPWMPRPPWVFATYEVGGLGNLLELLHESGHAIHLAAVRTRPAFLEWTLNDTAYLEATADVLGWDATEPAWQRRWLGEAADPRDALLDRYGSVMLDVCWALFEIELYRDPRRRPNDVWAEITADGLGVESHPEWSWWAIRGQLIELPGYMANYALSAIVAAAVRARLLELRGPWWSGDGGWYAFVSAALFAPGASRSPAALLEALLGGPVTADPLLADLRRG